MFKSVQVLLRRAFKVELPASVVNNVKCIVYAMLFILMEKTFLKWNYICIRLWEECQPLKLLSNNKKKKNRSD